MKKLAIGLAVVVALLVGAVLVVPSFINWNQYRPDIIAAAKDAMGRDLFIDGDLSLSLLPAPALSVGGVRLANIDGGSEPDMARLDSLQVRVAFVPLLSGELQVQSIRLVAPVILLEVLPDGRANWLFQPADAATAPSGDGGGGNDGGAPALSLDALVVSDGVLIYRDRVAGVEERIDGLNLEGSARSLIGPFGMAGEMRARGVPLTFDLRVAALETARPISVSATLGLAGSDATATLIGALSEPSAAATFSGNLKLTADDAAVLVKALTSDDGEQSPILSQPLSLTGGVDMSLADAALNDISLRLGDLQASGAVNATFDTTPRFDAALAVNRVDLDALLTANGGGGQASVSAGGAPDAAATTVYPAIPANLLGSLSLTVDGIALNGGIVRQLQANAAVADGKLAISKLSALLPGSSDVSLSGALITSGNAPQFDGKLEAASSNLRGLANWLRLDLSRVATDRLGSLTFTGNLRATPDLLQLYGVNLRLDATTITGGLAYRIQDRPSFGLELSVDRFNLDGYLVADADAGPTAARDAPLAASTSAPAAPLAALDGFDTNFKLAIGQLTYNNTRIQDIDIDTKLVGGLLTVNRATVKDLAGASLGLSATGANFGGKAAFKANLSMASNDLSGLARLARVELPVPPRQLGKADLTARLDGNLDDLKIDVKSNLAGGAVTLAGSLSRILSEPGFDLALDASHASLAGLSRRLELGVTPAADADGKVTLGGTLRGDLDAVDVNLLASAAGADLQAGGRITQLAETPDLALSVNAGHQDFVAFMKGLGVRYDPALTNLGGFGLTASLNGTLAAMQVPDLKMFAGPAALEGTLGLRTDGPRPYVEAKLAANEIIVDLFLPPDRPASAGRGGAAPAPGRATAATGNRRWSQQPIDLSALGILDADIDLSARGLVFRQYPFVEPRLKLAIRDGQLNISDLTGRLFQGTVGLRARLDSRPGPALALDVQLDGADIQEAMRTAVGLEQITGTLAFKGNFRTAGTSQWDLVNALNGDADVKAVDGAVRGIDMRRLSDRLAKLNETEDYVDLLTGSFSGGETAYTSMTGTWQIENGVATTRDTRADLAASQATLKGRAMLPAWQMDMLAELRLTEHQKAPPVGVKLLGPLDQPRRDLQTQAMEAYLTQRVGQAVLRKAIGKKAPGLDQLLGGGSPQQPSQQPQQQKSPRDQILEGLIRGLGNQ